MLWSLLSSTAGSVSGSTSGSSSAQQGGFMSYLPMILILVLVVVFFIFSSRNQKKKQKEAQEMLDAIQPGNKVKTIGGICGIVVEVCPEDGTFILQTGTEATGKSYLKFDKQAVYQTDAVVKKEEKKDDKKTEKKEVVDETAKEVVDETTKEVVDETKEETKEN